MKMINKQSNLDRLICNDLMLLTDDEINNIDGGILGLVGLVVGASALSYQLFKFGWDLGREAAR